MSSSSDEASPPPPAAPPPAASGQRLTAAASPSPANASGVAGRLDYSAVDGAGLRRGASSASTDGPHGRGRDVQRRSPTGGESSTDEGTNRNRHHHNNRYSCRNDAATTPTSNVQRAASNVPAMRMRLALDDSAASRMLSPTYGGARRAAADPLSLDDAALAARHAAIDRDRFLYRAAVSEVTLRDFDGEPDVVLTHTRPDGVRVVSRGVQTEYTKRHRRLGIVFRGHPMSRLVIFIIFAAPLLAAISLVSAYVNWRPQFHLWNGAERGNAEGEDPPGALLYLLAAAAFQFFACYLWLLPAAHRSLISDDASTANRDSRAVAAIFVAEFLPTWVGEFIVGDSFPYDKNRGSMWASYVVLYGGGVCWFFVVWFVYTTYAAEVMHGKARRAADEYLYALRFGHYRRQMERARRGAARYQQGAEMGAIEEPAAPRRRLPFFFGGRGGPQRNRRGGGDGGATAVVGDPNASYPASPIGGGGGEPSRASTSPAPTAPTAAGGDGAAAPVGSTVVSGPAGAASADTAFPANDAGAATAPNSRGPSTTPDIQAATAPNSRSPSAPLLVDAAAVAPGAVTEPTTRPQPLAAGRPPTVSAGVLSRVGSMRRTPAIV